MENLHTIRIIVPTNLDNTYVSINFLINFYNEYKNINSERFLIDFGKCKWIRDNILSLFGAILVDLLDNNNKISVFNMNKTVKNKFILHGFLEQNDTRKINHNRIIFRKFDSKDTQSYEYYVQNDLLVKLINQNSPKLLLILIELFLNVNMHSPNSSHVFISGAFAPKNREVYFTITNIGTSIKERVNERFKVNYDSLSTIKWAIVEGNTTKNSDIPGGLGLSLLVSLVLETDGFVEIVSDNGYWRLDKNDFYEEFLDSVFHGSCISFKIKLNNLNEDTENNLINSLAIDSILDL